MAHENLKKKCEEFLEKVNIVSFSNYQHKNPSS